MAENTKIEWADDSISFWHGCTRYGEGCRNCYAERLSARSGNYWGSQAPRLWIKSAVDECYRLNRKAEREGKERIIFVNSMSDFFEGHDGRVVNRKGEVIYSGQYVRMVNPVERAEAKGYGADAKPITIGDLRSDAFKCFDACDWLRLLLLTKRPENIPRMWPTIDKESADVGVLLANHFRAVDARIAAGGVSNDPAAEHVAFQGELNRVAYRPNCWLGTSISTQSDADRNVPLLRACRELAPVLFLSVEPLIEAVDLKLNLNWRRCSGCGFVGSDDNEVGFGRCGKCGHELDAQDECKIDWVIIGGESGSVYKSRRCDIEWIRAIVTQCKKAGVPCFVKQLGRRVSWNGTSRPGTNWPASRLASPDTDSFDGYWWRRLEDKKGGDPDEWPEDLRVREMPQPAEASP